MVGLEVLFYLGGVWFFFRNYWCIGFFYCCVLILVDFWYFYYFGRGIFFKCFLLVFEILCIFVVVFYGIIKIIIFDFGSVVIVLEVVKLYLGGICFFKKKL